MSHLLTISIGPVQDFIATARRSRDLWFGSWLLSELSKAAANYIHENSGELIFPSRDGLSAALKKNSSFIVVNKLVAEISVNDVSPYCSQVYGTIRDRLAEIKNDAFADLKKLTINGKEAIRWKEADEQLNSLVEFYWAAVPFDQSNYKHTRNKVEALLAARKVTRNFDPVTWGANVPKSSLDGLRESVIGKAVFDQLDDPKLTSQDRAKIEKRYGVRGKEQLSGVDLLKRHGKPQKDGEGIDSFFSTSHVAAIPVLNRLQDKSGGCHKKRGEALEDFILDLTKALGIGSTSDFKEQLGHVHLKATLKAQKCFGGHELLYDGRILFAQRFRELFPKNLSEPDKERLKDAKRGVRDFIAALNEKDLPRVTEPLPYYAILHGDGDRMGAVIDHEAGSGPAQHQKLSRALSEFAGHVKSLVEERHEGSCVYSGGDDVLALLPLHTALDCARDLADAFAAVLKDFRDDKDNSPTLSVGLRLGIT
jgi:CRISPR-associated protein Cmr2